MLRDCLNQTIGKDCYKILEQVLLITDSKRSTSNSSTLLLSYLAIWLNELYYIKKSSFYGPTER